MQRGPVLVGLVAASCAVGRFVFLIPLYLSALLEEAEKTEGAMRTTGGYNGRRHVNICITHCLHVVIHTFHALLFN